MASSTRTILLLQDECYRHRYIRSKDTSFIVERPERLRALKLGLATAIARLEQTRPRGVDQTSSDSVRDGQTIDVAKKEGVNPKSEPDVTEELAKALGNLNIATKTTVPVTNVCDISRPAVRLQYLSSHPAVRMIHAAGDDGEFNNLEHLDRLAKWARESEEKVSRGESEIPTGYLQGDLYSTHFISYFFSCVPRTFHQ